MDFYQEKKAPSCPMECCGNCYNKESSFHLFYCKEHKKNVNTNEWCRDFIAKDQEIMEKIYEYKYRK